MKILIVDDNCEMREMIEFYVRDVASEIHECCDGAEALTAYTNFQPNLVLMDWEMKQMDGLLAIKEIVASFPDAQILMVTQYHDEELRAAAFEASASGFIPKDDLQSLRCFLVL